MMLININDERFWDVLLNEACVEGQQANRIKAELKRISIAESEIRATVIDEAMEKLSEEICSGCGCLKDRKCTYKGSNCRVSKIMLEKTMSVLEKLKEE